MKRLTTVAVAGLATIASLAGPTTAIAHPTSSPKPTGTIFFFRENSKGNGQNIFSMTGAGKSAHRVKHLQADTPVYAAPKAHLLVYAKRTSEFKRSLVVANYAGKPKHTYKPKNFIGLLSVSPNGKYIGMQTSGKGAKSNFEIATIKGKVVAKLFAVTVERGIAESWNSTSNQVAIVNTSESTPDASSSLKIYNLKGKVVRTVVKNTGGSFNVAWSPSGQIAYSASTQIDVVKDTGGTPTVLYDATPNYPNDGLAYSPNGDFLAFGLYVGGSEPIEQQVWRIDANGSSPVKLTGKGTEPDWG
jgi:WD40 repeat protein